MIKTRLDYDGFVEARELTQTVRSILFKARISVVTLPPADDETEKKTQIWGSRSEFAIAPEMKTPYEATSKVIFVELVANLLLRSMVVGLVVSKDVLPSLFREGINLIHKPKP